MSLSLLLCGTQVSLVLLSQPQVQYRILHRMSNSDSGQAEQAFQGCSCSSLGQPQLEVVGGRSTSQKRLIEELANFILANNRKGRFNSAMYFADNFNTHIRRLVEAKQMMVFRRQGCSDKCIVGLCGWMLVDSTKGFNKIRWEMPEDIAGGHILYITIAVLTEGARIFQIKKMFEDMGYRDKVDRVYWNNGVKRTIFSKGVAT